MIVLVIACWWRWWWGWWDCQSWGAGRRFALHPLPSLTLITAPPSLFLIFLSLLTITGSPPDVNYRPIIGYNRTIIVDTYPIVLYALFLNLLTITWSPAGQTEGRVVKLGTVVECPTSSLRLWPDVCLSPSWRRKTQTGSYLMGGRRVWISRFEIDRPLSQWVEMRKIGGAAYMVHFWDWRGRVELILHILRPSMPSVQTS